jgi:hypothetical protein
MPRHTPNYARTNTDSFSLLLVLLEKTTVGTQCACFSAYYDRLEWMHRMADARESYLIDHPVGYQNFRKRTHHVRCKERAFDDAERFDTLASMHGYLSE